MRRELGRRIERHLRVPVAELGARPPGSPANRRAAAHVRDVLDAIIDVDRVAAFEELGTAAGRILALRGELARDPWFPAAFPFLDLPEHRRLREHPHSPTCSSC